MKEEHYAESLEVSVRFWQRIEVRMLSGAGAAVRASTTTASSKSSPLSTAVETANRTEQ